MCGRFSLSSEPEVIADYFGLDHFVQFDSHYNITPGQPVAIIRENDKHQKELVKARWGLVPSWMKEEDISTRLINARAETVHSKPSFRAAFKKRRCAIVADGFYEWQQVNGKKQPFYIHMKNNHPMVMAGLWECWQGSDDKYLESCTIITTQANDMMEDLHARMPAVLTQTKLSNWINTENTDLEPLKTLIQIPDNSLLAAYPVSTLVNNPRNDSKDCIKPLIT